MPPVAKAAPVKPAGERERKLYALVESKFRTNADFFKAVAARTKLSEASEKSAFYRIIRGEPGHQVIWRVRLYGALLGRLHLEQEWEATEVEEETCGVLPARLSPSEVRALFLELIDRIDLLVDRVADLEQRVPAKRQRGAKP